MALAVRVQILDYLDPELRDRLLGIGEQGICWHSLRHTWASWMTQAGVPLDKIQLLGGSSNLAMVQRYAHLAPEHLAEHAEAVSWAMRIENGIVGTGESKKAG